jgi:hypothetical protein
LPKFVALPASIRGAAKQQFKVIAKPEKLTIDNGQLTITEAAFRRDVIAFVVEIAILAPKSETGSACFLGGFEIISIWLRNLSAVFGARGALGNIGALFLAFGAF